MEKVENNINWIWVEDEEYDWLPGRILETNSDKIIVKVIIDENNSKELKLEKNKIYQPVDFTSLSGVDDLLMLGDFNKQTLLHNTRIRFSKDLIYTFIGHSILISVNPYKKLEIYEKKNIQFYKDYFYKLNSNVNIIFLI
jgi:myosin heavy subunit